jgi:sugar phosphate isomerase/epimerase
MNINRIHLGGTARSPEDVIAIHELGLQFAEIPIPNPDNFSELKSDYKALKKQLGIYYLCHGPQEGEANDIEALENSYLPKLMRVIDIMPDLDMKLLTFHLWMDSRFVNKKALAYKIDLFKRITERANNAGITICLENLSEKPVHLAEAFESFPSLGLTLDLGHGQLLSKEHTGLDFMACYPGRIKHIHLHDNRGGISHNDDLHLPVGDGIIDFGNIFTMLKSINYKNTITLELRPDEIKKCLGYVKRLLTVN